MEFPKHRKETSLMGGLGEITQWSDPQNPRVALPHASTEQLHNN
jgi:hypothetical protein